MRSKTFKVLLIGLGNIGMGYDLNLDKQAYILTHARAFSASSDFELVGGVDNCLEKREIFQSRFNCPAFENIEAALERCFPEVVVIATPTETHKEYVSKVLEGSKLKLILCEKPLSYELTEGKEIIDLCDSKKIKLFVNYMRRSDPGVLEIKKRITSGEMGDFFKGSIWYSKGLLHNGSHFFNLVHFWLGAVKNYKLIRHGRSYEGYGCEPDVYVEFEKGSVIFQAVWEEYFTHYTIELMSNNGRMRFEQGGALIEWWPIEQHPNLHAYKILSKKPELISSNMNFYQLNVTSQLAKALKGEVYELCSGEDALVALEVLGNLS